MLTGAEGGCGCGQVRFRLEDEPITVNCCHCRDCQRQTGSAFALNVLIEADRVALLAGQPEGVDYPSGSGMGQRNFRCPACHMSVWSIYNAAGPRALFLRAGALDDASGVAPRAHIFTESKLDWVTIAPEVPQFARFYAGRDLPRVFGDEGAARWRAVMGR